MQENTEALAGLHRQAGADTAFTLNPGNHFTDAEGRCALGIRWLLTRA